MAIALSDPAPCHAQGQHGSCHLRRARNKWGGGQ